MNDGSEYRWIYGLKTNDEVMNAEQQSFLDIADL
jgi:hypothetical protein